MNALPRIGDRVRVMIHFNWMVTGRLAEARVVRILPSGQTVEVEFPDGTRGLFDMTGVVKA